MYAFYLFTIWFLGPKLASATETYGVVGVFTTLLFWLYLVGRLVIGGATLNAVLVAVRCSGLARGLRRVFTRGGVVVGASGRTLLEP